MRTDCKHYESRTYASGETMRRCRIDLAPEAPWRCPTDCPGFARRLADAGWTVGSLQDKGGPAEPPLDGVAELLDAAEDIVNAAGPAIVAEVEEERAKARAPFWRRLFRRGGSLPDDPPRMNRR